MQFATRESGIPAPPQGVPYTPSHALREARRLGVGIEFSTQPGGRPGRRGLWPEDLDGAARDALRAEAESLGVPIPSLSSDWVWGFSEYHPTLDSWERGAELLAKDMDLTADLGARACLIHFARARATWDQMRRYCSGVADAAARRGVVAAFEGSLWRHSGLGGIDDLLRMVDDLAHPGLAVYAHPRGPGAACADEVRRIGPRRLACIHHTRWEAGTDYGALAQALREVGYRGPLVLETDPAGVVESLERLHPVLDGV